MFLAVFALLGKRWSPATIGEELGVATAAAPAGRGEPTIAVVGKVGVQHVGVQISDDGSFRNCDLQVFAALAVKIFPLPVHPVDGAAMRMVAKRKQRRGITIGDQPDIATFSAIAAIGSTEGDRALATKRHAASTPIAAACVQLRFIDEPTHRTFQAISHPFTTAAAVPFDS